jgi:hypothetical protein
MKRIKYYWNEKLSMKLAWLLPKRVAMWAYIRVHFHATCTTFSNKHPDEVIWRDALDSWEKS